MDLPGKEPFASPVLWPAFDLFPLDCVAWWAGDFSWFWVVVVLNLAYMEVATFLQISCLYLIASENLWEEGKDSRQYPGKKQGPSRKVRLGAEKTGTRAGGPPGVLLMLRHPGLFHQHDFTCFILRMEVVRRTQPGPWHMSLPLGQDEPREKQKLDRAGWA